MDNIILENDSKIISGTSQTYSLGVGLNFDGLNDTVNIPNNNSFAFQFGDAFSVSFIIKLSNLNSCRLLWIGDLGGGDIRYVDLNVFDGSLVGDATKMGFALSTQVSFAAGLYTLVDKSDVLNKELHITFIKYSSFSNAQCFVNGQLSTTIFGVGGPWGVSSIVSSFYIGSGSGIIEFISGIIFDTKIFNKALNASESLYLYNTKNSIIPGTAFNNIVADRRFDQKTGNTLLDSTGNNNGNLIGFLNTTPSVGNARVDDLGNSVLF